MIRYICSGRIPENSFFSFLCHANPDRLLDLGETSEACSGEYSAILSDISIGRISKKTGGSRLEASQKVLLEEKEKHFEGAVSVLDLGGSDGVTSLDLLQVLKEKDSNSTVSSADLYHWLYKYQAGCVAEYRGKNGQPALLKMGRLGLRLPQRSDGVRKFSPFSWISRGYLSLSGFRNAMKKTKEIPLVNPRCLGVEGLQFLEMDARIYDKNLKNKFHMIRVSNFLNNGYFNAPTIEGILGHLHRYLEDSGLLLVSRNVQEGASEIEHGSVWQKTKGGFQFQRDFGKGSEIKLLVDALRPEGSKCVA